MHVFFVKIKKISLTYIFQINKIITSVDSIFYADFKYVIIFLLLEPFNKYTHQKLRPLKVKCTTAKGAKILFSIFEFFREISGILPNVQYLFDSPD